jgi:hypothetical protein
VDPLPFVALALAALILIGRRRRAAARHAEGRSMDAAAARALLGVDEKTDRAEVQAAWRARMRHAHPDRGGSASQAAALNAARDRLLKG